LKLGAGGETRLVDSLKVGERLPAGAGVPIPSQAGPKGAEGVETGRATPKDFGLGRRDSPDHERPRAAAKAEVA